MEQGDVSLDTEGGTSVDASDDVLVVNRLLRAGSRDRQLLLLDANDQLADMAECGMDAMAGSIS